MNKDVSASISGCAAHTGGSNYDFNLSTAVPNFTVATTSEDRLYHVFASIPGDVEVIFGFDFTEALNYGGTVATKAEAIEADANDYFGAESGNPYGAISVPSGTTVMDILEDFTNEMDYPDKTTGASYISSINGLSDFDAGTLSGWWYMDGPYTPTCSVPLIGPADYVLTTDNTITWFYTTDYFNHDFYLPQYPGGGEDSGGTDDTIGTIYGGDNYYGYAENTSTGLDGCFFMATIQAMNPNWTADNPRFILHTT